MLKRFCLITVCLFTFIPTYLFAAVEIEHSGLDLSLGYRIDQLDWSIAGNSSGTNPNVLSELIWSDLEILQLQLDGWVETTDLLWLKTNTLFVGKLAYGNIFVGDNRDSDYAGDDRTFEWSRSENQSDDGFTFDASGAFGPKYEMAEGRFSVAPLLGYAVHMQDMQITEGNQTLSDNTGGKNPWPLGPIPALDSSYTAYWFGPWLGLDIQLTPVEKWTFQLLAEYHLVEYFAEANWNLRTNLAHPISFEHEAHGTGIVLSAKSVYALNQHWSIFLSGDVQFWQTGDGVDTTYFADGSRGGTKLNEVNWDSYATMLGLRYQF